MSTNPNRGRYPNPPRRCDQTRDADCWRACIASVLGLSTDEVPDFVGNAEHIPGNPWLQDTTAWLRARGLGLMRIKDGVAYCYGDAMMIASDGAHAVVMVDGEVWHDPDPAKAGLPNSATSLWAIVVGVAPEETP